ncbi:MAG: ATP-binding protein [Bacillota bacterium]|nr:ATP-binding protein [Bacillota bacterium]
MLEIKNILKNLDLPTESGNATYSCPHCEDVGFIVEGDKIKECSCRKATELARKQKVAGITPHLQKMTFEAFDYSYYTTEQRGKNNYTYRENAKAITEAAKRFTQEVIKGTATEGMLFMGNVGCGKTYLAAAIANELVAHDIGVKFVVVPDFLDELRATFSDNAGGDELALMEQVKKVPILILDDLGAHNYTEWSIKTLFSIINYRVNYELPMVVTTNLSVEEIENLIGSRIYSRLIEACGFFQMRCSYDIRLVQRRKNRGNRKK